ncbi:MAG: ADP-forming succinate--CoA ligase subunit beta [Polyangiaceae bacterium]|jgi:succinyl-CoA synthetase beta subunit
MKIHEYQAKEILARHGVPVPRGVVARTVEEAEKAAARVLGETGGAVVVVKAQIHAGGRGKGGGVRVARGGVSEATDLARGMLGMKLVTHQTGPGGQTVHRLYLEEGLDIARELYFGLVVDRDRRRVAAMASTQGGVDIESVASRTPEKIHTIHVDPAVGLAPYQARALGFALGIGAAGGQFVKLVRSLYETMVAEDCSLLEINPLALTGDGKLVALDAKVNLDDSADFRHPEWRELEDSDEADPVEAEAKLAGLSYVALDGNVGCLVNGAGLAMATMDIIKHYGAAHGVSPANFLDVGGGAHPDQVRKAFSMILRSPQVKAIFVNIFGGIMKCDVIADGIVAAAREIGLSVPLIVRLEGTRVEHGRQILDQSGLAIRAASSMAHGAQMVVDAVAGVSPDPRPAAVRPA